MNEIVERVVKEVEEAEASSNALARAYIAHLSGVSRVAVLYCGCARGVAQHLITTLLLSSTPLNIINMPSDYGCSVAMPYISEHIDSVVLFSCDDVGCLDRSLQALGLCGLKGLAVRASGQQRQAKREYSGLEEVSIRDEYYEVAVLLANLRLGLEWGRRSGSARLVRVEGELSLSPVVKELAKRYEREVKELPRCEILAVSDSMLAVGEYVTRRSGRYLVPLTCLAKKLATRLPTAVISTSAERHVAMEYIFRGLKGSQGTNLVVSVEINTDPLTAPLYGLILAKLAGL